MNWRFPLLILLIFVADVAFVEAVKDIGELNGFTAFQMFLCDVLAVWCFHDWSFGENR